MRLDKLTTRFQQALAEGQSLALGRDNPSLEPVHVMQALMDQEGGTTGHLLTQAGADLTQLRSQLGELLDTLGSDTAIFSLDLKDGRPLMRETWDLENPLEIAERAVGVGFREIIVLDLADVGMAAGNQSLSVCQEIRRKWPDVKLITGGGVRGHSDLEALVDAGCDGALVASALHDGRLRSDEVRLLTEKMIPAKRL